MVSSCLLCTDVLPTPARPVAAYCVICAHRTTPTDRRTRRPTTAGLMDAA